MAKYLVSLVDCSFSVEMCDIYSLLLLLLLSDSKGQKIFNKLHE